MGSTSKSFLNSNDQHLQAVLCCQRLRGGHNISRKYRHALGQIWKSPRDFHFVTQFKKVKLATDPSSLKLRRTRPSSLKSNGAGNPTRTRLGPIGLRRGRLTQTIKQAYGSELFTDFADLRRLFKVDLVDWLNG
jgi:hypothetical protein